jgi:hypothetical protein
VLHAYITDMERDNLRNRTYLRRKAMSAREKRRRLVEGLERRNADSVVPREHRGLLTDMSAGMIGYADPDSDDAPSHTSVFLSPDPLRQALDATDDATLMTLVAEANEGIGYLLPFLNALIHAAPTKAGARKGKRSAAGEGSAPEESRSPQFGSMFTDRLLTDTLSFDVADIFRVFAVLALIGYRAHGAALDEQIPQHVPALLALFASLAAPAPATTGDTADESTSSAGQDEAEG